MNGWKHAASAVLSVLTLCGLIWTPGIPAEGENSDSYTYMEEETSGHKVSGIFTYEETDTGITITSCDTNATEAEVPATISGKPVTQLGNGAFTQCQLLRTVTLPNSITKIGESAFYCCNSLKSLTIPSSVTEIGKGAFQTCTSLETVTLPAGLTTIPEAAFQGCSNLTAVTLNGAVTQIGGQAFEACTALTTFSIPETVTTIGDYAFRQCSALTEMTIPAACTSLGQYVWDDCAALTNLYVAAGNPAYADQNGVLFTADGSQLIRYPQNKPETTYTVPDGCTSLADWSFNYAASLETLDLNQVTELGADCFIYCTALQQVTLPEGITALNGAAFYGCSALESITLPSSLQTIGEHCFGACTALTSVTIPEGVTTIGSSAFLNCLSLKTVTLPDSVTEIGTYAFGYMIAADSENYQPIEGFSLQGNSKTVQAYRKDHNLSASSGFPTWGIVCCVAAVVLVAGGVIVGIVCMNRRH